LERTNPALHPPSHRYSGMVKIIKWVLGKEKIGKPNLSLVMHVVNGDAMVVIALVAPSFAQSWP